MSRCTRKQRSLTSHDVAQTTGLSVMSVSRTPRILDLVPPSTCEQVASAAHERNYTPDLTAGSSGSGHTDPYGHMRLSGRLEALAKAELPTDIHVIGSETPVESQGAADRITALREQCAKTDALVCATDINRNQMLTMKVHSCQA